MYGVFGFFGGLMGAGVLVDFFPEFPHLGLALGDFVDEWRLDMDHKRIKIILKF